MTQSHTLKRLLCAFLAICVFTLPVSAFVIGTNEDLEALTPGPENSDPVAPNTAPIAQNLEFETYRDVAIIESFEAFDPEGDLLSFRVLKNPARGQVTLAEDGSNTFTYTPYEGKKGKDSFTYVAVDSVGNTSEPATVKLKILKAKTEVCYADMSEHPAHRAAVRLAEEGVLVGQKMGPHHFFRPDDTVSREEFLTLAMHTLGEDVLFDAATTGFADDAAIAVWAKSSVASALHTGMVTGTVDAEGITVFAPQENISFGEASVLVDRLLKLTDVSVSAESETADWLTQPVANLKAVGVLNKDSTLDEPLTRGDCAVMLSNALDVLDFRANAGKFFLFR